MTFRYGRIFVVEKQYGPDSSSFVAFELESDADKYFADDSQATPLSKRKIPMGIKLQASPSQGRPTKDQS